MVWIFYVVFLLLKNCNLLPFSDLEDDIRTVNEFDSQMLFQAVVRCLGIIAPEKEIPTQLGKGMSGRVSACAKVAQSVKV